MALLFLDGFDHSGTTAAIHTTKYSSVSGTPTLVATPVRTGTGALQLGSGGVNAAVSKAIGPVASGTAIVVGVAFRKTNNAGAARNLVQVFEGATLHLAVAITTAGQLQVLRSTTPLATGATVLANNSWYYLELKAVIHDTTGSYELRLDGVTELSATATDTRNAGTTGQIDLVNLNGSNSATANFYFDDLYVCDGNGGSRDDFLGICKVETLLPQTGNGTNVGLTPSTGTDHGALVDENPPNTTDYNSSPTVGLKDTYNYPSMTLTGTVLLGVQTNLYVSKSDAAARQVCAVVRAGGTDYDGANVAPTTTFSYFSEVRALNPNTSLDWTAADIAALEAGMKVTV